MTSRLISVITVVYNSCLTLETCIKSVIAQEKELFDYWIIDGGSTDGSIDIIQKYEHRLAGWVSEPDEGIYDAMNKGIACSNCDWIYFLGADDVLQADVFKEIRSHLAEPYKIVFGNVKFDNNYLFRSKLSTRTIMHNTVHHQSAFYQRSLFDDFQYNQYFSIYADYELNIRIFTGKLPSKYVPLLVSIFALGGKSRGYTQESYKQIDEIRRRYIKGYWQNALISFLLRLYYWQKQFRFWLYQHEV